MSSRLTMFRTMKERGLTKDNMDRYVVVWRVGKDLKTLTYRPEGWVRTYPKDLIDKRAHVQVMTDNWDTMMEALRDEKAVAIPVRLAQRFGDDWIFAPPGYGI